MNDIVLGVVYYHHFNFFIYIEFHCVVVSSDVQYLLCYYNTINKDYSWCFAKKKKSCNLYPPSPRNPNGLLRRKLLSSHLRLTTRRKKFPP